MNEPQDQNEEKSWMSRFKEERSFLLVLVICFMVAAVFQGDPQTAMWIGFLFAGYSAIANDSIQTIGTFIASNQNRAWWHLWLFIGGVFVVTMTWSWMHYGGPVEIDVTDVKDGDGETLSPEDGPVYLLVEMKKQDGEGQQYREMKLEVGENGQVKDREALGIHVDDHLTVQQISVGLRNSPNKDDQLVWGVPVDAIPCVGGSGSKEAESCWHWLPEAKSDSTKAELWVWDEPLPVGATGPPPFDVLLAQSKEGEKREPSNTWSLYGTDGKPLGSIMVDPTVGGDVSNLRLLSKGFDTQTNDFHFLQLAAPLFLILLTRLRMPVSTTFLLLNIFAASGKSMGAVALKSVSGYVIAFVISIILWSLTGKAMKRWFSGPAHPGWRVAQWVTTGCLWSVWLMQDAANIAVFLPRSLSTMEFAIFCTVIVLGLGWLFRNGGEKIQEVVNEKSNVVDVRAATVLDFVYAVILYIFKFVSKIPMSTTWVFVGLLAGREIAMTWQGAGEEGRSVKDALKLAGRDLLYVTIGFVISVILAAMINPSIAEALFG